MMRVRSHTQRVAHVTSAVMLLGVMTAGCRPPAQVAGTPGAEPAPVNVGYGTAQRPAVTSSIASIDSTEIERRQVQTLADALRGLPGIEVIGSGPSARVRIRGPQSFIGGEDPLYVIDGTPVFGSAHALSSVNPHDVARIDVLKDGAAAIYGSRGGAGVIIITTKRAG